MKHQGIVKILAIALGLLSVISCSKGTTGSDGPSPAPEKVAITGEYYEVRAGSVILYGWCNQKEEEGLSAVYGFEYSDTDLTTAARTVEATSGSKDFSNKYSCGLTCLKLDTKYYYRAYTRFNGITSYGDMKTFTLTLKPSCPSGAVDLGLSVCWATCNIGASKPEEFGGYYQWAGTEDVTNTSIDLNWDNCPFHTGSDSDTGWIKYIPSSKVSYWSGSGSPDNKTVLDPEDDVAHVRLGGKWRMPTAAECRELRDNCTGTSTWQNGVYGWKFTSNKPGYTDKSIFLPGASYRSRYGLEGGDNPCYWSSSLYERPCFASYFACNSADSDPTYGRSRYDGLPVRPVSE